MQGISASGNVSDGASVGPVSAARRLEAALDRIAQLAPRARAETGEAASAAPDPDASEVAARLDRLIAQLRGVLDGPESAGIQS